MSTSRSTATGKASPQSNNIFTKLGLNPKSVFAGVSPSAPDEPGDPRPGEGYRVTSDNPFADVELSASPDNPGPATGTGGTLQNTTARSGSTRTDAATTGSNKT